MNNRAGMNKALSLSILSTFIVSAGAGAIAGEEKQFFSTHGRKDRTQQLSQASKSKDAENGKPEKKDPQKESEKKSDSSSDSSPGPAPIVGEVHKVTALELVDNPKKFLGKNVKFEADFFAFSNLALGYKPAFRDQKKHISFLVLRPESKIPLSELKLAMAIPKDSEKEKDKDKDKDKDKPKEKEKKDPRTEMLASLKDGDTIEIVGKVFSAALDDPWVDILDIKKLKSAKPKDEDTDQETTDAGDKSENNDSQKKKSGKKDKK